MPYIYGSNHEWPLKLCRVKEAWALTLPEGGKEKGEGVLILHPDTGYTRHKRLMIGENYLVEAGVNFLENYVSRFNDALDLLSTESLMVPNPSHGTHTASMIISPDNNEMFELDPEWNHNTDTITGGVSPKAALLPARVTRSVVLGYDRLLEKSTIATLAKSINHYAGEDHLGVISISLGTSGAIPDSRLVEATISAKLRGIIICAAAGQYENPYSSKIIPVSIPAKYNHVIGVSACDSMTNIHEFGFYGKGIDVVAPGVRIRHPHTRKNERGYEYGYGIGSGTSYATAFVAGATALWLAFHNRDKLIAKYGKAHLFDAFRYVLYATSDRRVEGYKKDDPIKTLITRRPIEINLYRNGGIYTQFEMKKRWGCGLIDVEALLRYTLPNIEDVTKLTKDVEIDF